MNDYGKIQQAFGKAIALQQGIVVDTKEKTKEGQEGQASVVELLTDIRDDIRLMRLAMEGRKQYETKEQKQQVRWKGQYENTGAMEVPETKNGQ